MFIWTIYVVYNLFALTIELISCELYKCDLAYLMLLYIKSEVQYENRQATGPAEYKKLDELFLMEISNGNNITCDGS